RLRARDADTLLGVVSTSTFAGMSTDPLERADAHCIRRSIRQPLPARAASIDDKSRARSSLRSPAASVVVMKRISGGIFPPDWPRRRGQRCEATDIELEK